MNFEIILLIYIQQIKTELKAMETEIKTNLLLKLNIEQTSKIL